MIKINVNTSLKRQQRGDRDNKFNLFLFSQDHKLFMSLSREVRNCQSFPEITPEHNINTLLCSYLLTKLPFNELLSFECFMY